METTFQNLPLIRPNIPFLNHPQKNKDLTKDKDEDKQ